VRRHLRFLLGSLLGIGALAAYLQYVGVDSVLSRAGAVAPWAVAVVFVLVVLEAVVDGLGVWASVRPLGGGLSPKKSVQFALAGDFFDTLSPAGPVSSEPIVARFLSVETETGYSDALGVRSVAKYVKSGSQIAASVAVGLFVAFDDSLVALGGSFAALDGSLVAFDSSASQTLLVTLGGAGVGLLVVGAILLYTRTALSRGLVTLLTPIVRWISGLYREEPHGKPVVEAAVARFWDRILVFRKRPRLVGAIAVAGITEQLLTAGALWIALAGTGTPAPLLPVIVLIPLPQVASVVPIPGSVGAYDVLLSGALVAAVGVPGVAAAAAVLLVRTTMLPFALVSGGVAVALLRGWRPRSSK
jgi:uncharacterized membrane protein YbhN (UPF0104 family)